MSSHIHTSHESVSGGFTETASDYDDAVRFNIEGAQRLVLSIPPGRYDDVLDVGCGTGWATQAVIDRFRPARVTGVDPAVGMLERCRAKLGDLEGVDVSFVEADVENMPVPDGAFDLVVCSMAYHWFPRKWAAAAAMARALRPGGVVAILMSGRGGEQAYRDVIANVEPINYRWLGAFDGNLRGQEEMEDYLVQAGLEPLDVWMETRVRHTTVEAYMERMRVVAGHMIGDQSEAEVADYVAKIEAELRARSGPRGWRYEFAKLFAIARKPA
ncbi:class I SAM-dependent methyltransferase [Miltoncostaea marina]|uniref:class I SAM-dependent methyltransferase n=1 Tax=Miltoncostaea marina TaxID=2843215 RepID=UPI001C3C9C9E|nr:class I SAM-dependent methyltransferase [Miltoncostaea marina]